MSHSSVEFAPAVAMRIAVDQRRSVAEKRPRPLFCQGPIVKTLVTVEAAIHLLAAQHENQTLEDILMRGTADRFALTFWTGVFSCHCEGPGILPFIRSHLGCDASGGTLALCLPATSNVASRRSWHRSTKVSS